MLVALVITWENPLEAQTATAASNEAISFACQDTPTDPEARSDLATSLAARIAELSVLLSNLESDRQSAIDSPPTTGVEEETALLNEQRIQQARSELTVALAREDCLIADTLPNEKTRGPSDPPPRHFEIPLYYITDRARSGSADAKSLYNAQFRKMGPEAGVVTVVLASRINFGVRKHPRSWRDATPLPKGEDFLMKMPRPLAIVPSNEIVLRLTKNTEAKRLLFFVHGFNVSFIEAVVRAAQLAHDIEFDGDVLVYSWPSVGSVMSYSRDEDTARISRHRLTDVLQQLDLLRYDNMYLVGHSMGARILSETLSELADTDFKGTAVREVVFAAADVNTVEFRDYLFPKMRERFKFRTTVYMSKNDFPLKVSRWRHEYPRLGDPTEERYLQHGIDVVDTSAIAPMRRSWGHSYLWDNPVVAGDFGRLINEGRGASQRALKAVTTSNRPTYWVVD